MTVDYDRLGLRAGDTLLDLGCGFGRHAYEALRRGAHVVACDAAHDELASVRGMFEAMANDGDAPLDALAATARGDATRLPFGDGSFDRVIASEVLEHIDDDVAALDELARVLRPGGTIAVTVPAWLPERICWWLSEEYHAPAAEGGHVRIYTEVELRSKLRAAGLTPGGTGHAHALHSPYWWLRCALGPSDDSSPLVAAYHRLLVWDIERRPVVTRAAEALLNPLIGKSVVLYARKPAHAPTGASAASDLPSRSAADRSTPPTKEAVGVRS